MEKKFKELIELIRECDKLNHFTTIAIIEATKIWLINQHLD